ncbi:uncharacterized protein METZ01_LOCUS318479 [marine metagenome]|uniref:Uncharacterized protein n=1 Tax=marine metagenome TaxID=408172 RepID=A0A382NZ42_9ZZZZ
MLVLKHMMPYLLKNFFGGDGRIRTAE